VSAQTILNNLIQTTVPPSLTSDVTIASGPHPNDTKTMHLVSRFDTAGAQWERNLMARIVSGNPPQSRFLLEQRIDTQVPSQKFNMWVIAGGDVAHPLPAVFVPWEGLPGTELKNFDLVLPFPQGAEVLDPATEPFGPGAAPPAGCVVVELKLQDPGGAPGSDRIRLWIETAAGKTIDHRAEHYGGAALLRVVTSDNWQQLPGTTNWGPLRRVTTNVISGRSTTVTVTKVDPATVKHDIFISAMLTSNTW
jgi:hypothetical protein